MNHAMNPLKKVWKLLLRQVLFLLLLCLSGCLVLSSCSADSPDRPAVITWAKRIVDLENRAKLLVNSYTPIMNKTVNAKITVAEVNQLVAYSNSMTALFNEITAISPPDIARSVHARYVNSFMRMSDSVRTYVMAVKQNDLIYFDQSATANEEAQQIGAEAYNDFEKLLKELNISCGEINYCE